MLKRLKNSSRFFSSSWLIDRLYFLLTSTTAKRENVAWNIQRMCRTFWTNFEAKLEMRSLSQIALSFRKLFPSHLTSNGNTERSGNSFSGTWWLTGKSHVWCCKPLDSIPSLFFLWINLTRRLSRIAICVNLRIRRGMKINSRRVTSLTLLIVCYQFESELVKMN